MSQTDLPDIDVAALKAEIAAATYERGLRYARQRAVISVGWNPGEKALDGTVHGSSGEVYETTAYFMPSRWSAMVFEQGQCTCPVGLNCKHVVALVLTAASKRVGPERKPAGWEQALRSLIGEQEAGGQTPLAIEVTLVTTPKMAASSVSARVVRPGRNGWVSGGLTWTRLSDSYHCTEFPAEQVRALKEVYALYRMDRPGYSYGEESAINLTAFGSRHLWPVLDAAVAAGVRLVHARKRLGDVPPPGAAELCLDATDGTSLVLTPVVRVAGTDADVLPLRFIGNHGLVYAERADTRESDNPNEWRLRLARLARPVPAELQRLALGGRQLKVPSAERSRFLEGYFPRLRQVAPVISTDESFEAPAISEPELVLRASYGDDHDLEVSWEWAYRVGETPFRAPLRPASPAEGYRDPAAERAILDALDVPPEPLVLTGIDTMRFTTELLPLLSGQPGLRVEVDGEPADYREAGDSLRIGVSTDAVAGETDWFDLGITVTVEGRNVPFLDVFLALSRDQQYLLLPDGAYFSLQKPELLALRRLIEEARSLQDTPSGELRISRFQVDLWAELAALGVVERQAEAWRRQLDGLRSIDSLGEHELPASLVATLRPYQLDGFRWLAFLWQYQLGGILADDMGLGKTLQSLALVCHVKETDPAAPPFLVVAPTSVVSNWAAESERFAPGLSVVAISDTLRRRGQDLDGAIAGADVVVTSYTLLRLDAEAYAAADWSGLILDEAQYTKNHQSKIYQCLRRIPAPVKLAITGTPMENNLMELWSLLSITAPGLFPSPTRFADYYAKPIEKRGDAELLTQLRRRIRPLVKRRTKEQVAADLPPKQEQVLEVDLHPRHRKLYQTHLQRERQKVLGLIDDMNRNRFTILRSLTLLRQLSLHAGLVDDAHADLPCAKLDTLAEHLRDVIGGDHRALVFSQFTGFLGQVRARLDEAGIPYCYLDGKTRNRAAVLARFKEGTVPVFLISLKAGGFGLNLTEADYCFLLDPWWNPATEAQAVDRTHRIGQTRNVMVYRLIAKDTIEEKVMALKERKAELFASVMDDGNAFGAALDADDIRGLFT
jgi:superfamily II DNA or RNA helicase